MALAEYQTFPSTLLLMAALCGVIEASVALASSAQDGQRACVKPITAVFLGSTYRHVGTWAGALSNFRRLQPRTDAKTKMLLAWIRITTRSVLTRKLVSTVVLVYNA